MKRFLPLLLATLTLFGCDKWVENPAPSDKQIAAMRECPSGPGWHTTYSQEGTSRGWILSVTCWREPILDENEASRSLIKGPK